MQELAESRAIMQKAGGNSQGIRFYMGYARSRTEKREVCCYTREIDLAEFQTVPALAETKPIVSTMFYSQAQTEKKEKKKEVISSSF